MSPRTTPATTDQPNGMDPATAKKLIEHMRANINSDAAEVFHTLPDELKNAFLTSFAAGSEPGTEFNSAMRQLMGKDAPTSALFRSAPQSLVSDEDNVVVCATCEEDLNPYSSPAGQVWVHASAWKKRNHDAVPKVVPRQGRANATCDYCSSHGEVVWMLVGAETVNDFGAVTNSFDRRWWSCDTCMTYVDALDFDGLIKRVMRLNPHMIAGLGADGRTTIRNELVQMWEKFLVTARERQYLGPRREPAKLNPRMMPKLRQGLAKFWSRPEMLNVINASLKMRDKTHAIPGVHTGDEDAFMVRYHPGQTVPHTVWKNFTDHLVAGIWASDLYWISENFTQLAIMAGQDFETLSITREDLPSPFGFMVYDQPIGVIPRPEGDAHICGVSWTLIPRGIWINLYVQGEDSDSSVNVEEMRRELGYLICTNNGSGIAFGAETRAETLTPATAFLATLFATWLLMNQPGVTDTDTVTPDKKYARAYQREHGHKPSDVRLVDLRKRPRRTPGPADDTRAGRPLEFRVFRKGHWKSQAYGPGWSLRKRKYIHPYIAGPEDAPLKDKATTVKILR